MKKFLAAALTLTMALSAALVPGTARAAETGLSKDYAFTISSGSAVGSTVNKMMEHVVEAGAEASDGKMQFTHYAAGQLGSDSEVLTEVLAGNVDIMAMASSNLVGTIQELGLFDLYCAMSKADTCQKLFADPEFMAQMNEWFERVGLKLIMWDPPLQYGQD